MALNPNWANEKKILIVEDDTFISEVLVLVIAQETPYQPLYVPDAFQALVTVNDVKPDLFLLDYHLPRMNGIELYDRLHVTQGLEHVRAIMISANLPQQEIKQRQIVGIRKPFGLDDLLDTIEKVLAGGGSVTGMTA
jgi:CheY-like chemotaxis protein